MLSREFIEISVLFAVAMAIALGALILRRWRDELRADARAAKARLVTKAYLQRVGGAHEDIASKIVDPAMRLTAVSHLLALLRGAERAKLIALAEADGLLRRPLANIGSWLVARRVAAVRVLHQFATPTCLSTLRRAMATDQSLTVRVDAALALADLGRLPPPRATTAMLNIGQRGTTRLDIALFRALAIDHGPELRAMLAERIPHALRAVIIEALGWSNDISVVPLLERAAGFDHAEIRAAALRAAARIGHPAVAKWIIPMLEDPAAIVRIQAVNSCAVLGLRSAVPDLRARLEDPVLWVRLRAQEALEQLAPPQDASARTG